MSRAVMIRVRLERDGINAKSISVAGRGNWTLRCRREIRWRSREIDTWKLRYADRPEGAGPSERTASSVMSSACSAPAAKRRTSSRTKSTTAFAPVGGADPSNCFNRPAQYSVR